MPVTSTSTIFQDIQNEFEFFFSGLNWTFIFIYVMCLYGIRHKAEFRWYNHLFNSNPRIKEFKVWVAGLIIVAFFCFFDSLDPGKNVDAPYVSALLRSWVVVIVFNSVFDKKLEDFTDGKPKKGRKTKKGSNRKA